MKINIICPFCKGKDFSEFSNKIKSKKSVPFSRKGNVEVQRDTTDIKKEYRCKKCKGCFVTIRYEGGVLKTIGKEEKK